MGVAELMEFKREVIRTKVPDKQEIKFNTNMFGNKTFLVAVEPVLDINDVCVGVNCVAVDVTLQVQFSVYFFLMIRLLRTLVRKYARA